jgi:hypothetical protein
MQTNNKDSKVVKLSPKQKEVIRLMREGKFIYALHELHNAKAWVKNNDTFSSWIGVKSIPYRTFEVLWHNGFLNEVKKSFTKSIYTISELGKTIDIN